MAVKFLEVDGARLRKAFKDRSLVMMDVSVDMGFDRAYLSVVIFKKKIRKSSADILDKVYGIPYEEYKPIPMPVMPEIPEVQDEEPLPWDLTSEPITTEVIPQSAIVVTLSDETIQKIADAFEERMRKVWD